MKRVVGRRRTVGATLAGLALVVVARAPALHAQQVTCDLHRVDGEVVGECRGLGDDDEEAVGLRLRRGDGDVAWTGVMLFGEQSADTDVATYEYGDGPALVLRTPFGWFLPSVMDLGGDPPRLAWSFSAEAPPSETDLAILDEARRILRDESVWDRADDRVCDPSDTTWSLYCAMAEGVRRVTGEYQHRQPALQIVRRVVERRWGDRVTNHRLMDFNNDPATTFAEILSVLDEARDDLVKAMR